MRLQDKVAIIIAAFLPLPLFFLLSCNPEEPLTIDEYSALMCDATNQIEFGPAVTWGEYSATASEILDTLRDVKPPEELRELNSALISAYESTITYADTFDVGSLMIESQSTRESSQELAEFRAGGAKLEAAFNSLPPELIARLDEADCTWTRNPT